jgi:hypothetical protein
MGEDLHNNNMMEEVVMGSSDTSTATACPLSSPLTARVPGLMSLAAIPAAVLMNPFFFGLAGGLLAVISLLLSPPRCRSLGTVGLVGAVVGGSLGMFVLH